LCAVSIERAGYFSLSFDKADKSKGKMDGCVKLASWSDKTLNKALFPDGQVLMMSLDTDKTGDTSKDIAEGVKFSLDKLYLSKTNLPICISFTTDSGGGGTVESVQRPLLGQLVIMAHTLVGNCTLHNINLEQRMPINKALLGITLNKQKNQKHADRDVKQLIYSCFAWEKEVGKYPLSCPNTGTQSMSMFQTCLRNLMKTMRMRCN
jgi:hypothetical protein